MAVADSESSDSPRANDSYSSLVSVRSSNWITPSSWNFVRSQPSPASSSPSFLQFGTIFENSICWNIWRPGSFITNWTASLVSMSMRARTSCCSRRSRMRTAASKANSWRSRISSSVSSS